MAQQRKSSFFILNWLRCKNRKHPPKTDALRIYNFLVLPIKLISNPSQSLDSLHGIVHPFLVIITKKIASFHKNRKSVGKPVTKIYVCVHIAVQSNFLECWISEYLGRLNQILSFANIKQRSTAVKFFRNIEI